MFALALKHVGKALRETDPVHSAQALAEAREITDQGYMILNEIEDMLDRLKASEALATTHGLSVQQRVRWCFKKHRVTYLLSQLECLKLSLAVMLQVLQLGKLIEAKRLGNRLISVRLPTNGRTGEEMDPMSTMRSHKKGLTPKTWSSSDTGPSDVWTVYGIVQSRKPGKRSTMQ